MNKIVAMKKIKIANCRQFVIIGIQIRGNQRY